MRRTKDDLSIMEKWHLIQTIKENHKRESITFDLPQGQTGILLQRQATLPTLKNFKKNKIILYQKTPNRFRHSCDENVNRQIDQDSVELTRLKNNYFRSKLLYEDLLNKKNMGKLIKNFKEDNKKWIMEGKMKIAL